MGNPLTITERQLRALKGAIQKIVETWHERSGVTERDVRHSIRAIWQIEDERELLQSEFHSVAEYLHHWLLHGHGREAKLGKRIELLRRAHKLRAKLGWGIDKLREFAKLKFGRTSLRSMSEEELNSLLKALEALCESQ